MCFFRGGLGVRMKDLEQVVMKEAQNYISSLLREHPAIYYSKLNFRICVVGYSDNNVPINSCNR